MITKQAALAGVEPEMLAAILQLDSQFGTSWIWARNHNSWNVWQFDRLWTNAVEGYKTDEEWVGAAAKNLRARIDALGIAPKPTGSASDIFWGGTNGAQNLANQIGITDVTKQNALVKPFQALINEWGTPEEIAQKAQKIALDNWVIALWDYLKNQNVTIEQGIEQLNWLPNTKFNLDEKMKAVVQKWAAPNEDAAKNWDYYVVPKYDAKWNLSSFKVYQKIDWNTDPMLGTIK